MPSAEPVSAWHALDAGDAVAAVASDAERGLSAAEARARLARHGPNALPERRRRSTIAVVLGQFRSPLIYLLFGAAALALAMGHTTDAIVVFAVVAINAVVGAIQEGRAERSLAALRRFVRAEARAIRDGRPTRIPARELVPGDLVVLEAGDAVTADLRILDHAALQISEAALTGESTPVAKTSDALAADAPLADRRDMAYTGTHVTSGRARGVVVATGPATELGRIAALAETAHEPPTPLQRRVAQLGRYVIAGALGIALVVLAVGLARGIPAGQIVMLVISQLVGMIPEGLPVAITIALAVGVQRMARRRAIVRRLPAVETLGSTTVICTDKTGTLTRNELTAVALRLPDGGALDVTGTGYAPTGRFVAGGRDVEVDAVPGLRELLEAGVLCSDADLAGPEPEPPVWRPLGDPTEVALVALALKAGIVPRELRARRPRRGEIPFDPAAKVMATEHAAPTGSVVLIKGAPEVVLELAGLDPAARDAWHAAVDEMAARALRVIAIAAVPGATLGGASSLRALAGRARLLGLVGQIDPPRAEVTDAVARCRAAGIRPVMITGDHAATALAIARAIGIAGGGERAVTGRELDAMTEPQLAAALDGIAVFARVNPEHKLRLVEAYQRRGAVVAMTGDGVNDAPALVRADAGIAMGSGTAVAKNAADVVITDDNFSTIVAAVEEGRVFYRNIKKAILHLISTSGAEVLVLLAAVALGYPAPFAAVQILWNNLVTEGVVTVT